MNGARRAAWRIALTHAAVIGALLALGGTGAAVLFERELHAQLDAHLAEDLDDLPRRVPLAAATVPPADEERDPTRTFVLIGADGRVRTTGGAGAAQLLGHPPAPGEGLGDVRPDTRRTPAGAPFRVASTVAWLGEERVLVRVARDAAPLGAAVGSFRRLVLVAVPFAIAIALAVGLLSARASLAGIERGVETIRRFTADAAHELRTPVGALRMLGEVALRRARGPEECLRTIEDMLEELARLSGLLDRMLLLARADAGQLPLQPVRLELGELAQRVAELYEPLAQDNGIELAVGAPCASFVVADPVLLEAALGNLVDNAVKATPRGGRVTLAVGDGLVTVSDTGPGIPPEHVPHVFERFYRADPSRARTAGGAGLGLAIARWIVESHGGTIRCGNIPGAGAEFRVRLPVAA